MTNGSPISYPSWEIDGVTYYLKLTFASYALLEQEGVRLDELKPMVESGKAPLSMVLKLGAAMLGTPRNNGRWKSLGLSSLDLADAIGQGRTFSEAMTDFTRFSGVVRDALKAPQAETAPAQPAE